MQIKTEWDLGALFKSDTDPEMEVRRRDIRERTAAFTAKWRGREDWLQDPGILEEALKEYEAWTGMALWGGDEGYYFSLRTAKDENDTELKARSQKVRDFANEIDLQVQFFELALAKVPQDVRGVFLAAPNLLPWRHFLERLFAESEHLLSEPEEKILRLKQEPAASRWEEMVSGFLSREERETVLEDGSRAHKTFPDLLTLTQSTHKNVRDEAALHVNDILHKYRDVAEAEMNALVTNKKIDDELRGYERPDAARHIADDVDAEIVDALIASVAGRFDIAQRFYALKAKLLGLPRLAYHERNVPFGKIDKKVTFEEAYALTRKVFAGLDQEFADILDRFLANGQIDVFPAKNKADGAFCASFRKSRPTYILLNYANTLHEVTTLAHEMGHGINNELMRKAQTDLNFGAPTSTAEIASIFMEDFILEEVGGSSDPEMRLAIVMMRLNDEISSIFRQVAAYRFEAELHAEIRRKGYLSKDEIGALFRSHMASYMGDAVSQDPGSENWWIYWGHFRSFFYNYAYALGQIVARALQAKVKADPAFVRSIKEEFLSAGTSKAPRDIFRGMGIDIADPEFFSQGLAATESLLKEAEDLAKSLGKI